MTEREKQLPSGDLKRLQQDEPQYTGLISRKSLIRRLKRGREARARFVESHLNKGLAFQIRSLRDREKWTQGEFAAKLGMKHPNNVSARLENPNYGRHTLSTLKNIAATCDVGLVVWFVPFSRLADWASGTPHIDKGLSPDFYDITPFESDRGLADIPALDATAMLGKIPAAQTIINESQPNWFDPLINTGINAYYQTYELGIPVLGRPHKTAMTFVEGEPAQWQPLKYEEIPTFEYAVSGLYPESVQGYVGQIEHFRPRQVEQKPLARWYFQQPLMSA